LQKKPENVDSLNTSSLIILRSKHAVIIIFQISGSHHEATKVSHSSGKKDAMAFNADQAGMAFFLLFAALLNIWFVFRSYSRSFRPNSTTTTNASSSSAVAAGKKQQQGQPDGFSFSSQEEAHQNAAYQLLTYAVLVMAIFDIPWVWLCMIQCWNNMVTSSNSFHQNSGDDSFGCKFMGWYSTFSLFSMMGSHCLVVFYLMKLSLFSSGGRKSFWDSPKGLLTLALFILVAACLFGSMPLLQGDGYHLTNGGFCYADFTNTTQAAVILSVDLAFLSLSTVLWCKIGRWTDYWLFYGVFFVTWVLWVPATIYGISTGKEIPSPYMIIGAVVGHGNALINPILYGIQLFRTLVNKNKNNVDLTSSSLLKGDDNAVVAGSNQVEDRAALILAFHEERVV
jgi:hypothetical protein